MPSMQPTVTARRSSLAESRTSAPIGYKLRRATAGAVPRVLDLYSGCGGLALSLHRAGCEILGGVEFDPDAARSQSLNFHRRPDGTPEARHAVARDVTKSDAMELLRTFGNEHAEGAVDILVGEPPCPVFTRVGRAKLREVAQHPNAYRLDPRATVRALPALPQSPHTPRGSGPAFRAGFQPAVDSHSSSVPSAASAHFFERAKLRRQ